MNSNGIEVVEVAANLDEKSQHAVDVELYLHLLPLPLQGTSRERSSDGSALQWKREGLGVL